ncbi:MAG: type I methionyl aminopeptidase [Spirochaetales bacterium]|nr:type I methionyl aminopeptidase [Spirochaetales bacterium]
MIALKTKDQIDRIRESCRLLARMFHEIEPMVQAGMTTLELDRWAENFIRSHGGKPAFKGYQGFPGTLCTSINQEVIHGIPKNKKIVEGDLVSLDCGIDLKGFFSDMAVTFVVGEVTSEEKLLVEVTRQSLDAGIVAAQPGARVRDISNAVTSVVKPHRFGIVHQYCGHGVGFSQHEDPQVPNAVALGTSPRIVPGMVLAIEPMINLGKAEVRVLSDDWTVVTVDGKKSAHFEHTIAILEESSEVLTRED